MLLLIYVTILCFTHMSPKGMETVIWPVFSLLKVVHFSFLERLEILFVAYYLLIFSTTIIPYLFSATYVVSLLLPKIKANYIIGCLIFMLTIVFYIIKFNVKDLLNIYAFINQIDLIFFIAIPIFLFGYTYIFKFATRRKAK